MHILKRSLFLWTGLDLTVDTFPEDHITDGKAYLTAFESFQPGDAVTIFTPDDTHFEIALAAINKGIWSPRIYENSCNYAYVSDITMWINKKLRHSNIIKIQMMHAELTKLLEK